METKFINGRPVDNPTPLMRNVGIFGMLFAAAAYVVAIKVLGQPMNSFWTTGVSGALFTMSAGIAMGCHFSGKPHATNRRTFFIVLAALVALIGAEVALVNQLIAHGSMTTTFAFSVIGGVAFFALLDQIRRQKSDAIQRRKELENERFTQLLKTRNRQEIQHIVASLPKGSQNTDLQTLAINRNHLPLIETLMDQGVEFELTENSNPEVVLLHVLRGGRFDIEVAKNQPGKIWELVVLALETTDRVRTNLMDLPENFLWTLFQTENEKTLDFVTLMNSPSFGPKMREKLIAKLIELPVLENSKLLLLSKQIKDLKDVINVVDFIRKLPKGRYRNSLVKCVVESHFADCVLMKAKHPINDYLIKLAKEENISLPIKELADVVLVDKSRNCWRYCKKVLSRDDLSKLLDEIVSHPNFNIAMIADPNIRSDDARLIQEKYSWHRLKKLWNAVGDDFIRTYRPDDEYLNFRILTEKDNAGLTIVDRALKEKNGSRIVALINIAADSNVRLRNDQYVALANWTADRDYELMFEKVIEMMKKTNTLYLLNSKDNSDPNSFWGWLLYRRSPLAKFYTP